MRPINDGGNEPLPYIFTGLPEEKKQAAVFGKKVINPLVSIC